jgi:hypothetical protein
VAPQLPGLSLSVLTGARRYRAFPSRNAWFKQVRGFEALQNADYVVTTRGSVPPSPAPLGIGIVAGSPSKSDGRLTEGQVEQ